MPLIETCLPRALTGAEARLFSFLLRVNRECHAGATLRVAGGWVRDRVMGRDANDIDIAIETPPGAPLITGAVFAELIQQVQAADAAGMTVAAAAAAPAAAGASSQQPQPAGASKISVIKTNPEKSKHIETAQIEVEGFHVEFCHLRKDDYAQSGASRVPIVVPASPIEDAQRRDFCCNALFYNLHTERVEDFVGGVADIESRVLRCPLAPQATFLDDPLRIVRGVRFCGQLGFTLDASVLRALTTVPSGASVAAASRAASLAPEASEDAASMVRASSSRADHDATDAAAAAAAGGVSAGASSSSTHHRAPVLDDAATIAAAFAQTAALGPFYTAPWTPPIHPLAHALLHKVSRERVGIEVGKMLRGARPSVCVAPLVQTDLLFSAVAIEMHSKVKTGKGAGLIFDRIAPICPTALWAELGNKGLERLRLFFADLGAAYPGHHHADPMPYFGPTSSLFGLGTDWRLAASLAVLLGPAFSDARCATSIAAPLGCTQAERVDAVVVGGMKLPVRIGDAVAGAIAAEAILRPHAQTLLRELGSGSGGGEVPAASASGVLSMTLSDLEARRAVFRARRKLAPDARPTMTACAVAAVCADALLAAAAAGAPTTDDAAAVSPTTALDHTSGAAAAAASSASPFPSSSFAGAPPITDGPDGLTPAEAATIDSVREKVSTVLRNLRLDPALLNEPTAFFRGNDLAGPQFTYPKTALAKAVEEQAEFQTLRPDASKDEVGQFLLAEKDRIVAAAALASVKK
jgi:hypothetical protein